jgi:dGTPase
MDSRVVRAACLAHDLGHPPFGHIGERELQRLLDPQTDVEWVRALPPAFHLPRDSFEGNAQSFRIVTRLAFRERNLGGGPSTALDLTRATLRALLKYPWTKDERLAYEDGNLKRKRLHKWGAYGSEQDLLEWARGNGQGRMADFFGVQRVEYRSMEAQAMDWADDISYAVHDVEDFFRAGYIPLHVLRHSTVEFDTFFAHAWERISDQIGHAISEKEARTQLHGLCEQLLPSQDYRGTQQDREQLHAFAGDLIERSVEGLCVLDDGVLRPGIEQLTLVELLKEMTWYYVIKRPALSSVQRGQAALLRELYRGLTDWVTEEESDLGKIAAGQADFNERRFPARLLAYLHTAFAVGDEYGRTDYTPQQKVSRAVTDYIVSLTEAQAIMLNSRLTGRTEEAMLDNWD